MTTLTVRDDSALDGIRRFLDDVFQHLTLFLAHQRDRPTAVHDDITADVVYEYFHKNKRTHLLHLNLLVSMQKIEIF